MLCRKKLVLFLTLTTLGLMYISANHYLSESSKQDDKHEDKDSEMIKTSPVLQSVMQSKKTQLEKYLQPSSVEQNVEFRTANSIPAVKKISKTYF